MEKETEGQSPTGQKEETQILPWLNSEQIALVFCSHFLLHKTGEVIIIYECY